MNNYQSSVFFCLCPALSTKIETWFAKVYSHEIKNIRPFEKVYSLNIANFCPLRILTGKKHPKIKLQRLRKIRILTFGSLVHQINSCQEVLGLEQILGVTGKTQLFMIGQFCSLHSICLNSGFWQRSFEWKRCDFNLSGFNLKTVLQFFEKDFCSPENLFQS